MDFIYFISPFRTNINLDSNSAKRSPRVFLDKLEIIEEKIAESFAITGSLIELNPTIKIKNYYDSKKGISNIDQAYIFKLTLPNYKTSITDQQHEIKITPEVYIYNNTIAILALSVEAGIYNLIGEDNIDLLSAEISKCYISKFTEIHNLLILEIENVFESSPDEFYIKPKDYVIFYDAYSKENFECQWIWTTRLIADQKIEINEVEIHGGRVYHNVNNQEYFYALFDTLLTYQYFTSMLEVIVDSCQIFSSKLDRKEGRAELKKILQKLRVFENRISTITTNYKLYLYKTQGAAKTTSSKFHINYQLDSLINLTNEFKDYFNRSYELILKNQNSKVSKMIENILLIFAGVGIFDLIASLYSLSISKEITTKDLGVINKITSYFPIEYSLIIPAVLILLAIAISSGKKGH